MATAQDILAEDSELLGLGAGTLAPVDYRSILRDIRPQHPIEHAPVEEQGSYLGNLGGSLVEGFTGAVGDTLSGATRIADTLFDDGDVSDNDFFNYVSRIKGAGQGLGLVDDSFRDTTSGKVASAIGGILPTVAAGGVGLGARGILATSSVLGAAQGAASVGQDIDASDERLGQVTSQSDRNTAVGLGALSGAVTETLPIGRLLSKTGLGNATKKLVGDKAGLQVSKDILGTGVVEGSAEAAQTYIQDEIARRIGYDKDRKSLDGIIDAAETGGIVGALMHGTLAALGAKNRANTNEQAENTPAVEPAVPVELQDTPEQDQAVVPEPSDEDYYYRDDEEPDYSTFEGIEEPDPSLYEDDFVEEYTPELDPDRDEDPAIDTPEEQAPDAKDTDVEVKDTPEEGTDSSEDTIPKEEEPKPAGGLDGTDTTLPPPVDTDTSSKETKPGMDNELLPERLPGFTHTTKEQAVSVINETKPVYSKVIRELLPTELVKKYKARVTSQVLDPTVKDSLATIGDNVITLNATRIKEISELLGVPFETAVKQRVQHEIVGHSLVNSTISKDLFDQVGVLMGDSKGLAGIRKQIDTTYAKSSQEVKTTEMFAHIATRMDNLDFKQKQSLLDRLRVVFNNSLIKLGFKKSLDVPDVERMIKYYQEKAIDQGSDFQVNTHGVLKNPSTTDDGFDISPAKKADPVAVTTTKNLMAKFTPYFDSKDTKPFKLNDSVDLGDDGYWYLRNRADGTVVVASVEVPDSKKGHGIFTRVLGQLEDKYLPLGRDVEVESVVNDKLAAMLKRRGYATDIAIDDFSYRIKPGMKINAEDNYTTRRSGSDAVQHENDNILLNTGVDVDTQIKDHIEPADVPRLDEKIMVEAARGDDNKLDISHAYQVALDSKNDVDPQVVQHAWSKSVSDYGNKLGDIKVSSTHTIRSLLNKYNATGFSKVPELRRLLRVRSIERTDINQGQNTAKSIYQKLKGTVGEVGSKLYDAKSARVNAFLRSGNTELLNNPELFSAQDVRNIIEAQEALDKTGARLVELGLLDPEIYLDNKGKYLPTKYARYLAAERGTGGAGKSTSPLDYLKQRDKTLTPDVKEYELGQIKDPAMLVGMHLALASRDAAITQYFQTLSAAGNSWVIPSTARVVLGDTGRGYDLVSAQVKIDDMRRQLELETNADQRAGTQALIDQYQGQVDAAIDSQTLPEGFDARDYVRMPSDRRYKAFRGSYVHKDIRDDLIGTIGTGESTSFIDDWVGKNGKLTRLTKIWKGAKTWLDPTHHLRNIAGSLIQLDISTPTPFGSLILSHGTALQDAINTYAKGSNYNPKHRGFKLAQKHGVEAATFSANEGFEINADFMSQQKAFARELDRQEKADKGDRIAQVFGHMNRLNSIKQAMSKYGASAGHFYQLEETAAKAVKIDDYLKQWEKRTGRSYEGIKDRDEKLALELEAVQASQDTLFDYSAVPEWLRQVRNMPIGAPFLTFMYKTLPSVPKAMAHNPQKMIKYVGLPAMLSMAATSFGDFEDDAEYEQALKALPDYYANKTGAYLMPFKDKHGRATAVDLGFMLPWTPMTDLARALQRDVPEGHPFKPFIDSGIVTGPGVSIVSALTSGVDPFTKYKISEDYDSPGTKLAKGLEFAYNQATLPVLSSYGPLWDMVGDSAIDAATGVEKKTLLQDVSRLAGVGSVSYSPAQTRSLKIQDIQRQAGKLQTEMRKKLVEAGRQGKSSEERATIANSYRVQISNKFAKLREL